MGGYFSYPAKAQVVQEPNQVADPTNTVTQPLVTTEMAQEVQNPNIVNELPQVAEPLAEPVAEPIQNTNILTEPPQVAETADVAEAAETTQNPTTEPSQVAETQKKSKKSKKKSKNAHPK